MKTSFVNCLNCDTPVNSKFCPNCGQRSSTERITFKSFSRRLTNDLIDTDKGFLYNLKNLTIKPEASVNNYIDGKRKNIFNPISYAVLAITAYLLLMEFLGTNSTLKEADFGAIAKQETFEFGKEVGMFLAHYVKFFFLLHIVYLSVFERLFFSKRNIYELMTMNAFIVGHAIIIGMLFFPIFRMPIIFDPIILLTILIISFFVFKRNNGKAESIVVPVFSLFVSCLLMFLVPMLVFYLLSLTK